MLEARGLGARFGRRQLWQEIDLSVRAGQILGILGQNGSGKTTLLRCLAGLRRPEAGTIAAPSAIGYVAQQFRPGQPLPVADFVAAGLAARKGLAERITREERRDIDRTLDRVGAAHLSNRTVAQLSGGESRLVLIARALVSQARLLILDEPMAGLDLRHQAETLRLFRTLSSEGCALVWSTHDPNHLLRAADQVLLLHGDGAFTLASPDRVLTTDQLQAQFRLPFHKADTAAGPHFIPDLR